jgi:hypothetical protein
MENQQFKEASHYQDFFDFLYKEHNLILTISEMNEIVFEAKKLTTKINPKNK